MTGICLFIGVLINLNDYYGGWVNIIQPIYNVYIQFPLKKRLFSVISILVLCDVEIFVKNVYWLGTYQGKGIYYILLTFFWQISNEKYLNNTFVIAYYEMICVCIIGAIFNLMYDIPNVFSKKLFITNINQKKMKQEKKKFKPEVYVIRDFIQHDLQHENKNGGPRQQEYNLSDVFFFLK